MILTIDSYYCLILLILARNDNIDKGDIQYHISNMEIYP